MKVGPHHHWTDGHESVPLQRASNLTSVLGASFGTFSLAQLEAAIAQSRRAMPRNHLGKPQKQSL
jgi:hypothetical protein